MSVSVASPLLTALRLFASLLLLAIPVGIVMMLIGLVQYFRPAYEPSALEILQRRYAQGEITQSEYEELRKTLEDPQP